MDGGCSVLALSGFSVTLVMLCYNDFIIRPSSVFDDPIRKMGKRTEHILRL